MSSADNGRRALDAAQLARARPRRRVDDEETAWWGYRAALLGRQRHAYFAHKKRTMANASANR